MRHATDASGNPMAHSKRLDRKPPHLRRHLGQVSWLGAGMVRLPGISPSGSWTSVATCVAPFTVAGPLPILTAFPDIASLGGEDRCPAFADPKASETYGVSADFSILFSGNSPRGVSTDHNILCFVLAFLPLLGACSIHAGAWILNFPPLGSLGPPKRIGKSGGRAKALDSGADPPP